jgi:hypothetical protein
MESGREALLNALMRSLLIVVSDVSLYQAMQLVRVPYQEEIKTLPSERTDESFTDGI